MGLSYFWADVAGRGGFTLNPWLCPVCGGSFATSRIPGLLRCSVCAFQTANLKLSIDEVSSLYGERYFTGDEYADYLADRPAMEKSFRRRLKKLLEYTPQHGAKHLFEVGCAYGLFLNLARTEYRSVSGIDVSKVAVDFAQTELNLDVQRGDLLTSRLAEQIDVACLWDTIEHLSQPHLYIEKLATAMPIGGIIAISTGDIESYVARWRGGKWRQIHPPTHLHYFSRKTLSMLLERYGFSVKYAGYDGMYRSVESMSYIILATKHRLPNLHNTLKRLGLLNFDLYLNLRDTMLVIGEKV